MIRTLSICVLSWPRRRVELINYKGGSGRILAPKLNKNHGKWLSNYFFNEICKFQKNQKIDVEKNTKKNYKNPEKMFLIKIWTKINLGNRNCNFQSPRGHENITKSPVNNNASTFHPQNPKTHSPFFGFSCTRTDHLTSPIDRARSQLLISFFLASLRSF